MYVKICYEKMPSIWYIIKMFTFDVKHTYLLLSAAVLQSKGYLPFAECCSTAKWSIPTFCWVLQYCKVKHAYHLLSAPVLQSKAYLPSAECCSTAKWSIPIFCWVLQYCKVKHTYLLLSAAALESEAYLPSAECCSTAKWNIPTICWVLKCCKVKVKRTDSMTKGFCKSIPWIELKYYYFCILQR